MHGDVSGQADEAPGETDPGTRVEGPARHLPGRTTGMRQPMTSHTRRATARPVA